MGPEKNFPCQCGQGRKPLTTEPTHGALGSAAQEVAKEEEVKTTEMKDILEARSGRGYKLGMGYNILYTYIYIYMLMQPTLPSRVY